MDFSWELAAPQLNQFINNLSGNLQASGQVSGNLADMELFADINAQAISYEEVTIDNLQANLQRRQQTVAGSMQLSGAAYSNGDRSDSIQSMTVDLAGTESAHQVTLAASSDYGAIELELQGGFTGGGLAEPADLNWQGALERGQLDTDIGMWQVEPGTAIAFDRSSMSIETSCWQQNQSSVCIDTSANTLAENFALTLNALLSDYPLSGFNHPDNRTDDAGQIPGGLPQLPELVSLAGTIDAELTLTIGDEVGMAATIDLQPENVFLTIRSTENELSEELQDTTEQRYALSGPRLSAALENDAWTILAGTRVSSADGVRAGLQGNLDSLLQVSPDGGLTGELTADLGDIGWLSAFTGDIQAVEGTLSGRVGLSGTLSDPRFTVDFRLADGGLSVLPLGITINQLTSDITSLDDGSIQLQTTAQSGEGSLRLQGLVTDPFTAQRSLQSQIQGSEFTLAEIPDLNLVVTPNVTVEADDEKITVNGSLTLPTLAVSLVELPAQAVDVSRDAVVINYPADQPQLARSIAAERSTVFNLPLIADLDIILGEQVSFSGFGLTTDVAGNLNVRQQENGTNLTYGELEIVSGQYTMYGRTLQIRQGKLLFFGAYDNPALDIRATREVEAATVGVLMNGTLKNINSQLFSTPALSDGDIISIMVTGKPISEIGQGESTSVVDAIANLGLSRSQGLTNQVREQLGLDTLAITNTGNINDSILTIGKYLTPDLFIRYGIGLFDQQSKLALDYTLTERITLQAETGEYQSVDVIYRVER